MAWIYTICFQLVFFLRFFFSRMRTNTYVFTSSHWWNFTGKLFTYINRLFVFNVYAGVHPIFLILHCCRMVDAKWTEIKFTILATMNLCTEYKWCITNAIRLSVSIKRFIPHWPQTLDSCSYLILSSTTLVTASTTLRLHFILI